MKISRDDPTQYVATCRMNDAEYAIHRCEEGGPSQRQRELLLRFPDVDLKDAFPVTPEGEARFPAYSSQHVLYAFPITPEGEPRFDRI